MRMLNTADRVRLKSDEQVVEDCVVMIARALFRMSEEGKPSEAADAASSAAGLFRDLNIVFRRKAMRDA